MVSKLIAEYNRRKEFGDKGNEAVLVTTHRNDGALYNVGILSVIVQSLKIGRRRIQSKKK